MIYLGDYSYVEAKKILGENRSVICPISAPEAIQNLPLNTSRFITEKIAEKVGENTGILLATPILQGIITPFKPIGDVGTHKNRFCGLISDSVRSLCACGVKKIFFLTSSDLFSSSINEGIKNYSKKLPADFSYEVIFWQNSRIAHEIPALYFENLAQYWRNEAAIFMLANELKGVEVPQETPKLLFSQDDFTKCKKRGLDPEKLRKLSPNYQFSQWTDYAPPKTSFFEELCGEISGKIKAKKL